MDSWQEQGLKPHLQIPHSVTLLLLYCARRPVNSAAHPALIHSSGIEREQERKDARDSPNISADSTNQHKSISTDCNQPIIQSPFHNGMWFPNQKIWEGAATENLSLMPKNNLVFLFFFFSVWWLGVSHPSQADNTPSILTINR